MNKDRRKQLAELAEQLESIKERLEALRDEEQDYYDNMPMSIQDGIRGETAQEAVDNMEAAIDALDEVLPALAAAQE